MVMRAFGLRKKESIMLRPRRCVLPFEDLGLPESQRGADRYLRIRAGAKGGRLRLLPIDSPARIAAVRHAETLAEHADSHLGDPARELKQNLRRFAYVLARFGLTWRERGATGHGLRHQVAQEAYAGLTGEAPPVAGGHVVAPASDREARLHVAGLAGHGRVEASRAYLGAVLRRRRVRPPSRSSDPTGPAGDGGARPA
jgi:hypothetical protein